MTFTELCKPFDSLTLKELYAILRLRSEVFVLEQQCVFLDADEKDFKCQHLMLYSEQKLVAYARIVPPGVSFQEASIGRVVTSPAVRGKNFGKILMRLAISNCERLHGLRDIRIGAQSYLQQFYESFGFVQTGESYLEDDIPHIEMVKKLP